MRHLMAAGLAFGIIMGGAAQAQPIIKDPDWVRRPTSEQISDVLPPKAVRKGVSGRATMRCTVTTTGSLRDCKVETESPTGYEFGAAVLRLAPSFLMKPRTEDGRAVEAQVDIPIQFKFDGMTHSDQQNFHKAYAVDTAAWAAAPSLAQFEAAYPAALRGKGVSGTVTIRCRFKQDGELRWCEEVNEAPAGRGFGKAAKSLLPLFRADMSFFGATPVNQLLIDLPFHFVDPQSSDWASRTIPKPVWIRTVSAEAAAAAFPAPARAAGLKTGRAVVRCEVSGSGALASCTPNEETPPGMGFGQAAVTVAQAYEMLRWTQEGTPTEGVVLSMPIRLNLPEKDAARPAPKP